MIDRKMLSEFVDSVESWRERFPSERGDATQIVILIEEIGELARAILRGDKESASEEWADALFVLLKIPYICELDTGALARVAAKNSAKTTINYYVNDEGKVVERGYVYLRSAT
ncbi:MAG: MazG nucleotide pyrophosphohydrolase domain-containing protein [Mariprofundales bacterium]|nr:MazG nucleotide pyrophosphohydrolase domain-containing protein [Mariprofundales bacterium]